MSSIDFSKTPHLALKTSGELQRIPLENDGTVLIGASSHCKLRLEGRGIRSLHCVIVKKDGRVDLRDWNTGCTSVNGELIKNSVALQHGDQVKIADHEITVLLLPTHSNHDLPATTEEFTDEGFGDEELTDAELADEEPGKLFEPPASSETASRIEDLQEELKRSAEQRQELEKQLYEANQSTHEQREECLRMEDQIRDLEAQLDLPAVSETPTAADIAPAASVELLMALKNQVEVLLTELKASQEEIATLKESPTPPIEVRIGDQHLENYREIPVEVFH